MTLQYLNNLRGIAILLIIFSHSLTVIPRDMQDITSNILYALVNNVTILFVVLAGYFFLMMADNFHYGRYLKNKFFTVILPYILMSIPAIMIYMLGLKGSHNWIDLESFQRDHNIITQYLFFMVTGAHLGPLWFIPVIIINYILSPLYLWLARHNFLTLIFIASIVPAVIWGRSELNDNILQSFIFFLPAYLLGMVLFQKQSILEVKPNQALAVFIAYLIGLIILAVAMPAIPSSYSLIIKLAMSFLVLSFGMKYLSFKNVFLDICARLSFFLFFIHGYFAGFLRPVYGRFLSDVPDFIVMIGCFTFILIASFTAFFFAKIILKQKSKFIIGA